MADPVMTDLAADVVGPDVKFHHSKLNVKSGDGSRGFKWHQDIQGWPHTDYSPVTIGVYIDGCGKDQGPLACVRGSHEGPLYSMYDDRGNFVVHVRDEELGFLETIKNPGMYDVAVAGDYGVVVGDTGNVLTTSDGGETWTPRDLPEKERLVWLRAVSIVPGTHGFIVGANGFTAAVDHDRIVLPEH